MDAGGKGPWRGLGDHGSWAMADGRWVAEGRDSVKSREVSGGLLGGGTPGQIQESGRAARGGMPVGSAKWGI